MKEIKCLKNIKTGELKGLGEDWYKYQDHWVYNDAEGDPYESYPCYMYKLTTCLFIEEDELKERIVEEETEFDEGYNRAINELLSQKESK